MKLGYPRRPDAYRRLHDLNELRESKGSALLPQSTSHGLPSLQCFDIPLVGQCDGEISTIHTFTIIIIAEVTAQDFIQSYTYPLQLILIRAGA